MNQGIKQEISIILGGLILGLLLTDNRKTALGLSMVLTGLSVVPVSKQSFTNQVVLITGGSRGLGLALAKGFLTKGAKVALLARDKPELENALSKLQGFPTENVFLSECDLTDTEQLKHSFNRVLNYFKRIDILVNNAGTISVGPFQAMVKDDFTALLNLQVNAVVQAIQMVLPEFLHRGKGSIVNISSVGGKIPVPHMSSYCASKYALAGLSESIGLELAAHNIKVTTVYPGLMRTGSPIQAVFKGNSEKEYAWFATGDVLPGLSVSAEYAVSRILDGLSYGNTQVIFPWTSQFAAFANNLFPELFASIGQKVNLLLPKSVATVRKTGAESRFWLDKQLWYRLFKNTAHRLEVRLNQAEKLNAEFNLGLNGSPN